MGHVIMGTVENSVYSYLFPSVPAFVVAFGSFFLFLPPSQFQMPAKLDAGIIVPWPRLPLPPPVSMLSFVMVLVLTVMGVGDSFHDDYFRR